MSGSLVFSCANLEQWPPFTTQQQRLCLLITMELIGKHYVNNVCSRIRNVACIYPLFGHTTIPTLLRGFQPRFQLFNPHLPLKVHPFPLGMIAWVPSTNSTSPGRCRSMATDSGVCRSSFSVCHSTHCEGGTSPLRRCSRTRRYRNNPAAC
jgi:hypothetical protein